MVYMHPRASARTRAYTPASVRRVPNQPRTPNRAIRIDDDLWRDYGEACAAEETTRSDDLRTHMIRKVRTWKRRQKDAPERA